MATKLTLSLDSRIIGVAKKYAERKGVSLSKLVEEYLTKITTPKLNKRKASISQLRGIAGPVPPDFDYKQVVRDYVYEKHTRK